MRTGGSMPFVPEAQDAYNSLCQKKKNPLLPFSTSFLLDGWFPHVKGFPFGKCKKKRKKKLLGQLLL
jgi:hypothetical protein